MKDVGAELAALTAQFVILSLIAFGGANAVIPEIQRQSVDIHHWMSAPQFAALFAIAQAAPGPNVMIATLVGWKVAGIAGGIVATLAMCAPSCLLVFGIARVWDRFSGNPWRNAIGAGLTPVTVGLVVSSAWVLSRAADASWRLAVVTLATAGVAYFSRLNPLWCLAAGGVLGLCGALG